MLQQRINEIYNILFQFEKIDSPDSNVNKDTYIKYLDRLYVWYFVCKVTIKRGIKADGLFLEPNLHLIS